MKRTKKFLVGLLAALSVLSGALGLVACDEAESSSGAGEATEIEKVYAQYVVYAESQGQTPLSYEDWLATIKGEKGDKGDKGDTGAQGEKGDTGAQGEKGDKGDKGDTGAQGEKGATGAQGEKGDKGDTGAQGVGIEKVEIDANGDLLITFTNGTKQTVEMPEKQEHVHTFGEWTNFTTDDVPCENRLFFRVCADCNAIEWKQGAYSDHDFTTVTTAPTCQAGGYDTKTCEICGKVETVNLTPIVEHIWATEYSHDNSYHWFGCATCEERKEEQEHTIQASGECSVCNELVGATEGIVYELLADGTAQVVMYEGTATRVRIADTYQGAPVTKIGNEVFKNSAITSIVIPESVTSIGSYAFSGCNNLTSVYISSIEAWCNISLDYEGANPLLYAENLYLNNELVTEIEIPNTITEIKGRAFSGYESLTSIEIPDSVTSIGSYAFSDCNNLTSVVIGNGITSIGYRAFSWCNSLTSVTIGENVTSIDREAFAYCTNLQFNEYGNAKYLASKTNNYFALIETKNKNFSSYTIHNDTKIINRGAFEGCSSLTSITCPAFAISDIPTDNLQKVVITSGDSSNDWAFSWCDSLTSVTIGDSVTSVADNAFHGCTSLTSVTIGDSVTSIGDYAFYYCTSLTSIVIPDSVTSIGDRAFSSCSSLTSIEIPDSVTSIGDSVFSDCSSLTSIEIPDGVTSIGSYAFSGCNNLTSIEIPDNVTSIGDRAFSGCNNLTSVVIGNGITSMNEGMFAGCGSLVEITLPFVGSGNNAVGRSGLFGYVFGESAYEGGEMIEQEWSSYLMYYERYYIPTSLKKVTITGGKISYGAFYNCYSLTSVVIGDSVTSIGSSAFYNCYSLTSVVIGDSVTSIGSSAFYNCSGLESVYYGGTAQDWNNMTIGSDNSYFTSAKRYFYSENEPPLNGAETEYVGNYWHYNENGEITVWVYTKNEEN